MHRVCGMYVGGLVVRCLHAGRSVYAACTGTSSLTVLRSAQCHTQQTTRIVRVCVCSNDPQTTTDDTCTTRRAIPPAAAALQRRATKNKHDTYVKTVPVSSLFTLNRYEIGVAYLGDEPRNQ